MSTSPLVWTAFLGGVVVLLVIDLALVHRKPHAIGAREAALWSAVWVSIGVLFGAGVWAFEGSKPALEYYTSYLLEKGLSVDNLFVFLVIFRAFSVPRDLQHRVLFWGILGAVVMRGAFIAAGVTLLNHFGWLMYVFGAFLVFTGARLLFSDEDDEHPEEGRLVSWMKRVLPMTADFRGPRFVVRENGRRLITPLLLVLVTVELTDVLFATDSIPAVFAVTRDPFIIFSSNILAILGLRALFFLLADVIDRFAYLHVGLALVLIFIGGKMLVEDVFHVSVEASLLIVMGVLAVSGVASLVAVRRRARDGVTEDRTPRSLALPGSPDGAPALSGPADSSSDRLPSGK